MITLYVGFSTLWGYVFLGFAQIDGVSLTYFYISGIVTYVFVAALITFFSFLTMNTPGAIISSVVTCMILGFVSEIVTMIDFSSFETYVSLVPGFVPLTYMIKGTIEPQYFIISICSSIVLALTLSTIGILLFRKRDLK